MTVKHTWSLMAIYIGLTIVDPGVIPKLNEKHQVTEAEVKEALQWPAKVRAALENDPKHGERWVALAEVGSGRPLIAWLLPAPDWAGEQADTWVVKTARWV